MVRELRRLLTGLGLTALLGYPMLFYVHKFNVPWVGGANDFRSYHEMVLHPLEFGAVRAPFAMRQLTTLIANGFLKLGLVFPNEIAFDHFLTHQGQTYTPQVFFALILANFIGIVLAGAFVYATVARDFPREAPQPDGLSAQGMLAVGLMLLSGPLLFHVISPLVEGWTWFLVAFGFYFYRAGGRAAYAALLVLPAAVFQRELLPLVFAILPAAELLSRRGALEPERKRFLLALLAASLAAMLAYYLLRAHILPVNHTDLRQISPSMWPHTLFAQITNPAVMAKFVRVLVKMNLLLLWIVAAAVAIRGGLRGWDRHFLYALAAVSAAFALISLIVGADSNADRYIAITTPIFAVSCIELLLRRNRPAATV